MRKEVNLVNVAFNSNGSLVQITPEEKLWMERIERYPLWYRYVPEHIKKNELVWNVLACSPLRLDALWKEFGYDKNFKDKRTRNEIGQEKHEARKCSECGK